VSRASAPGLSTSFESAETPLLRLSTRLPVAHLAKPPAPNEPSAMAATLCLILTGGLGAAIGPIPWLSRLFETPPEVISTR